MEDTLQGTPADPSASVSGGNANVSAGSVPSTNFEGQPSAVPSDATQGGVQGGQPTNGATQPDEVQRRIQSEVDKVRAQFLAEQYKLQQELNQQRQFQMELLTRQTQSNTNPFDPQTQTEQYWDWKMQAMARSVAEEARKGYEQSLSQTLQQLNEQQWIAQHPNVDVNAIRMYNRMNGIPESNLEVGYKLMTYPQNLAQVAQNASNQTANNFRQPIQGANPVRPVGQAGGEPTYNFYDLVKAVNERGESALAGLSQTDRDEFWRSASQMAQRVKALG